MTKIIGTMSKGEIQIRAIFENPGLNNKGVALVARAALAQPGDMGEKTVAWYRSHARKGTLGKALMAVVHELGGPGAVPSAAATSGAPRATATVEPTLEQMAEALRARGYAVARALIEAPKPIALPDRSAPPPAPAKTELRKAPRK